ncbi:MAG: ABC transporter ATP-binding protein [Lachnospiraceae bacterium]|nr:ABC transporter ATP-binding protein [Lachnospiraceae bacterium]
MSDKARVVIEAKNLDISFKMPTGNVHALRGVNFTLRENEVLALVGESGCGKSITAKTIMGILPENGIINSGEVIFNDGKESIDLLTKKTSWRRKNINGSKISMIFQDPMTSLNPTMTIGSQLITSIRNHEEVSKKEAYSRSLELLYEVGITDPARTMEQYPHQLSGGMRQRIVIAIALSCNPKVIICDEPTTALDVTIQNRILELIQKIQRTRGISVIFITHNLGVVAKIADYVGVMYAGKIIEYGNIFDIFFDPKHPYTWGLLSAVPDVSDEKGDLYSIPGTPPNLAQEIVGDAFAPRNPYALEIDFKAEPPMFKVSNTHYVASWLMDERAPKAEMPETLKERIAQMKKEGLFYVESEE